MQSVIPWEVQKPSLHFNTEVNSSLIFHVSIFGFTFCDRCKIAISAISGSDTMRSGCIMLMA